MEYLVINEKILEVFIKCNIKSFPLDCSEIINKLGYKLYKYSELSEKKKLKCLMVSDESLKLHNIIYYNDDRIESRARFSIMHELGHIILEHGEYRDPLNEAEANHFASNILAPRMAIHYSRCKNHIHVAKHFNISIESATYAFDDYRRWYRKVTYKMDKLDKRMYGHFYNDNYKGFVYNTKTCKLCGKELLNERSYYCNSCFNSLSYVNHEENDRYLHAAENNWLYGGIN